MTLGPVVGVSMRVFVRGGVKVVYGGAWWVDAHRYRLPRRQTCCGGQWACWVERSQKSCPRPRRLLRACQLLSFSTFACAAIVRAQHDVPHLFAAMIAVCAFVYEWLLVCVRCVRSVPEDKLWKREVS